MGFFRQKAGFSGAKSPTRPLTVGSKLPHPSKVHTRACFTKWFIVYIQYVIYMTSVEGRVDFR